MRYLLHIPIFLCSVFVVYADVNEEFCKNLTDPVLLEAGKLPITALATFQGSGNTWFRQLLGAASGYKTGDVYASYGNDVFPEFSSLSTDQVIAIKTHVFSQQRADIFGRAIVISRHPLDALFAEFNRMYGGNKTGYAHPHHLLNADGTPTWKWDAWMTHIGAWVDFHRFWLKEFKNPVHIIYYSNLKSNLKQEIVEVIEFLGLVPDMNRINCAVYFPKPPYFKRKRTSLPFDKKDLFKLHLSKADKAIKNLIELVSERFGINSEEIRKFNLTQK